MTAPKINVLIVEDSLVVQGLLTHVLSSDPEVSIMGVASSGEEALKFIAQNKPDVITMDVHMTNMDGYETTRRIMEAQPVPIVIVSTSVTPQDASQVFRALEAGAVAAVEKPSGIGHPQHEVLARKLVQTVKAMSEVKVIRRWPRLRAESKTIVRPARRGKIEIVAIGVSTGGPPVLETILSALPSDFAAPILIVQHIATGFLPGLVDWLTQTTHFPVHIATHNEALRPGSAYLAPDGYQMGVSSERILLNDAPQENNLRPAASYLFRSVAAAFGANAAGVLLTGMGRDGAAELKLLRDKGAITFAQDQETSVVHGMPGEAIKLGAACYILPPERIAAMLVSLVKRQTQK